jgi:hypothetical protein
MNKPIILEIGIHICLACPYPDCISSDTELCHLIKDEVRRIKALAQQEQDKTDREMTKNIQNCVKRNPLTMPQLSNDLGYKYEDIERLIRIKKLKVKRSRLRRNND